MAALTPQSSLPSVCFHCSRVRSSPLGSARQIDSKLYSAELSSAVLSPDMHTLPITTNIIQQSRGAESRTASGGACVNAILKFKKRALTRGVA